MDEAILQEMKKIEEAENVRILHAVESGSRAWGFASPDSDYDVRFIYLRRPEEYLRLDEKRDVIEWKLDKVMDINGWDVKKALQLAYKTNPTLFEWNNSPVVYRTSRIWKTAKEKINEHFMPQPAMHHYYSMAVNNYYTHEKGKTILLKRYFYAIRPLLAAKWILKKQTPPPVLFTALLQEEKAFVPYGTIEGLLERKQYTLEQGKEERIAELDEFIEKEMKELEKKLLKMKKVPVQSWEPFNKLFLQILHSYNWEK